jgi:hypothetical protein
LGTLIGSFSAQCKINQWVVSNMDKLFGGGNKLSRAFWTNFAEIPTNETTHCDFTFEVCTQTLLCVCLLQEIKAANKS